MEWDGTACAICMKPPTSPCKMLCGHTFCLNRCLLPQSCKKVFVQCPHCYIETHIADLQFGGSSQQSPPKSPSFSPGGRRPHASSKDYQPCMQTIPPDAFQVAKKLTTLESLKAELLPLKNSLLKLRESQVSHKAALYGDIMSATDQMCFVTDCALEKAKLLVISSSSKEKSQMKKLKNASMQLMKRQTALNEKAVCMEKEEHAATFKEFEQSANAHLDGVKELQNSVQSCECSGISNFTLANRFYAIHVQLQDLHLVTSDSADLVPLIEATSLTKHSRTPQLRKKMEWDVYPNKIFVGSLSDSVTEFHLHEYFSKFGIIKDVFVSEGQDTYRCGFVTYSDVDSVSKVLENQPHQLLDTQVTVSLAKIKRPADNGDLDHNDEECTIAEDASVDTEDEVLEKMALDVDPNYPTIFVGQLKQNITESDLRTYFTKFGTVIEVEIMRDREKGTSRGFGFLTFADRRALDGVLETCHFLDECRINVRPAIRHGGSRERNTQPFKGRIEWKIDPNKIFIGALPKSIKDFHLYEYFSQFGIIRDVFVSEAQDSRRCGFITFRDMYSAKKVLENQPHTLNGIQLKVSLGKIKPPAETDDFDPKAKETEDASASSTSKVSANEAINFDSKHPTIYVGQLKRQVTESDLRDYFSKFGTVTEAEVIRDKEKGTSRGFGFVTFADSGAIDGVMETCHFLHEGRLNVRPAVPYGATHDPSMQASDMNAEWDANPKKIFVAPLPDSVADFDLYEYFSEFGSIRDVFVPKEQGSRRCGYVTFRNKYSAQMVLERTPHTLHGTQITASLARFKSSADNGHAYRTESIASEGSAADLDPHQPTIYVGQLNAKITSYDLRNYFSKFGTVTEAEVITNRTTGVSRGFGFVTFANRWVAEEVLDTCHFLDEYRVYVRSAGRDRRKQSHNANAEGDVNPKKIFIGALPASAVEFDLYDYFYGFGPIKDVFVPKDQGSRRCGYVTFRYEDSAQRVLDTMPHRLHGTQITVSLAREKRPANIGNTPRNVLGGDIWGNDSSDSESTISVESPVDIDPKNPRIFVGHLKPNITSYDLRTYFSKFGTVTEAQVVTNRRTYISKGFGFVTFANPWVAEEVLETCHFIDKCHLNVKPAGSRGPFGYLRMHYFQPRSDPYDWMYKWD